MVEKNYEIVAEIVKQAVNTGMVPSAALAVGVKNHVLIKETYGMTGFPAMMSTSEEKDRLRLINTDTLYDMASITKIMSTTMIALRFIENGMLDLNDTLADYFSDMVTAENADVTIYELMTHTSGVMDHIMLMDATEDNTQAVKIILTAPLAAKRGERVIYSCMGYILLGKILEKVASKTLDVLAKEWVFEPLGMKDTAYIPTVTALSKKKRHNIALTERNPQTGEWLAGVVHDENARFLGGIAGNSGLFSNLKDCITFTSMLACGGKGTKGIYLAKNTLDVAIKNYTYGKEQHRGLGFHLANKYDSYSGQFFPQNGFGHTGFTGTSILVAPETGLYVVILTNRVHPTRDNIAHLRLRRLVHTTAITAFNNSISRDKRYN